jgi:hypothetical protein
VVVTPTVAGVGIRIVSRLVLTRADEAVDLGVWQRLFGRHAAVFL